MERFIRNLTTGRWHVRRILGHTGADAITHAVTTAERGTSAQIKVVIEGALQIGPLFRGQTARDRALEVFGFERVWDTSANNGILLYVLVAERDAEIVADRGFNGVVGQGEWSQVCDALACEISGNGFVPALLQAVARIGAIATQAFPSTEHGNELSDAVRVR